MPVSARDPIFVGIQARRQLAMTGAASVSRQEGMPVQPVVVLSFKP